MIPRRSLLTALLTGGGALLPNFLRNASASQRPARATAVEQAIWKSFYDRTRVWGYVDKHSVVPGETFDIMLSTGPRHAAAKGKIEIFRIGYYDKADRKLVWQAKDVGVAREEVQMTAAALGASWPPGYDRVETDGWQSG